MKQRYEKPLTIEELAALPDSEVDASEIPELDERFRKNAKVTLRRIKTNISLRLP